MTPETLIQIQNIIEKFGFPVFVALCGLLLFAAVFRYMTKAIEKKDSDFKEYVEKRDAQIDGTDSYVHSTSDLSGKLSQNWKVGSISLISRISYFGIRLYTNMS